MDEFLRTPNLIITFTNVLSFMIMQTLFFWYIAAESIGLVIDDKTLMIKNLTKNLPEFRQEIIKFLKNNQQEELALEYSKRRTEYNQQLLFKWMTPPFSLVIGILFLLILYELYLKFKNKSTFDQIDLIVLSTVFLAFVTEIIFYFIVVQKSRTVSDMDILIILFESLPPLETLPPILLSTFPTFNAPTLNF